MRPSSAKGMRAFCCDSLKILQPISSSRCSMPSCFFLLIPDATAGLLNLADTLLRVIASGQFVPWPAVTGGCAHCHCALMRCERYWFVPPRQGNGGYLHQRDHGQGARENLWTRNTWVLTAN